MTWLCGECGTKWHDAVPTCCSCLVDDVEAAKRRALKAKGERDEALLANERLTERATENAVRLAAVMRQRDKAEGDTARLRDASREAQRLLAGIEDAWAIAARAALVVADEAPSEPKHMPSAVEDAAGNAGPNPAPTSSSTANFGSLGAVEAPGQVTDGGPPQATAGGHGSAVSSSGGDPDVHG